MKVSLKMERKMAWENIFIKMEIFLKVILKMIKKMVWELILKLKIRFFMIQSILKAKRELLKFIQQMEILFNQSNLMALKNLMNIIIILKENLIIIIIILIRFKILQKKKQKIINYYKVIMSNKKNLYQK